MKKNVADAMFFIFFDNRWFKYKCYNQICNSLLAIKQLLLTKVWDAQICSIHGSIHLFYIYGGKKREQK